MGQSARLAAYWYATALVLVASALLRLLTPPRWYPLWWAVAELGIGIVVGALAWWVSRGARPARPAALVTGSVIVAGAVALAVLDIGYEFAAVPAVLGLLATATSPEAFGRTTGGPATFGEAWAPAFDLGPRPGVTAGLQVPPWQPGMPPAGGPRTDGQGRHQQAPQSPRAWGPPPQQPPTPPQQQAPAPQPVPWPGGQGQGPPPAGHQPAPQYPAPQAPSVRSAQQRMATEYGPAGRSVPALGEDAPPPGERQPATDTPVPAPGPYAGTGPPEAGGTVTRPPAAAGTEGGAQAGEQAPRARRHRVPAPEEPETVVPEPQGVDAPAPERPEPVVAEEALPRPTWEFDPRPRGRRAAPPPDDRSGSGEHGVEWAPRKRRHATPEPDDMPDDGRAPEEE